MKLYKGFIKEEVMKHLTLPQPVILTESELDHLIEGESVIKIDAKGNPCRLYYTDLKMIISHDYKTVE